MKMVADAVLPQLRMSAGRVELTGALALADDAIGVVLLAHGSGSSRVTPQDAHLARLLRDERLSTVVLPLLTPHEDALDFAAREHRVDLRLLAHRLAAVTDWLRNRHEFEEATIGYFAAGTVAAAALMAAAELGRHVGAVVSRSGRPDLAGESLGRVDAPTLLIVGSADRTLIELNGLASARLKVANEVAVVPGAPDSFDEAAALEVAMLASRWFGRHLSATRAET